MILSTPFSRQNRTNQSWTNATSGGTDHNRFNSLRRPQKPAPSQQPQLNGTSQANGGAFKSLTLNRLDLQRQRQQRSFQTPQPQRNLSSLGRHLNDSPNVLPPPAPIAATKNMPIYSNGTHKVPADEIYAPASIASPHEFTRHKNPRSNTFASTNGDSTHYAATNYRGATPSESGRSGRESALGNLLERFGTLRRRAKWRRSTSKVQSNGKLEPLPPLPPHFNINGLPPPPPQTTALDPEIYATGKRQIKAEDIYAEGSRAIDGNSQRRLLLHQLNESIMAEGETRTIIDEQSKHQPHYRALVDSLINWINDELAHQRIIVTDLQDDLHDGQILGKLIEKLHQIKLDIVEVTQNEFAQKQKLRMVLNTINRILTLQARWAKIRWTVEGIHEKNMVEIIHLLVTLAIYYRAPIKLQPDVRVQVFVVQKHQGNLVTRSHEVQLTESETSMDGYQQQQRDAFDTLIEHAPDKLVLVKQSLVRFANRHLNKINMSCFANRVNEILDPEQFSDGLLLVFLIASLENYFVPLGNLFTAAVPQSQLTSEKLSDSNNNDVEPYTLTSGNLQTALEPDSYINTLPIHKLHNVNLALQLMEEAGVQIKHQVRAEDIVNGNLKSVLRVLYALFSRYKHV